MAFLKSGGNHVCPEIRVICNWIIKISKRKQKKNSEKDIKSNDL